MPRLFEDSWIKVQRAQHHIAELEAALDKHQREKPPTTEFDPGGIEPDGSRRNAKVNIHAVAPPPITSATAGDVLHNLRAALDLLAVRLVELNKGSSDGVAFPFAQNAGALKAAIKARNFDRASAADQTALINLAPYCGGNDDLRALHDLDIQDKHHRLIPHGAILSTPQVGIKLDPTGKLAGWDTKELVLEITPGSQATVQYVFPKNGPLADRPFIPTMKALANLVSGILDCFENLPR